VADRRKTLLIVNAHQRDTLTSALRADYRVLRTATGESALQMMQREDVDLVLLEIHLAGIGGFEALKIIRENYPYVEVIVHSGTEDLDTAIEAMRHGAYHYTSGDVSPQAVRALFARASERQDLSRDVTRLSEEVAETERS
jgi:DNA-binding NtrC family response regulator